MGDGGYSDVLVPTHAGDTCGSLQAEEGPESTSVSNVKVREQLQLEVDTF